MPFPIRANTKWSRISLQPRTQRSQRMQESKSTAILGDEPSFARPVRCGAKRGRVKFSRLARASSSQSPECCSRVHGLGWSAINSSTSVRRARCTFSEFVFTTIPASTGRTQDAVKTRAPTSTTHIRHTPTGVSFCWWHKVGTAMPFRRAASNTVVPAATETLFPSIVSSTSAVLLMPASKPSPLYSAVCRP